MVYEYNYLIGSLALLVPWILLYLWRKDTRKEMVLISLLFGIGGLFVDPIYSSDWWKALTITGTMPGIESFLFGFATGGIGAVAYVEIFNKKLKYKKKTKRQKIKNNLNLLTIILSIAILFFGSYFLLNLNSFEASFPALLIPTSVIWMKRKDLIINSIVSGILLTIISIIFYHIPEILISGWLNTIWNFNILSGITFLEIALEDLIWFFMSGLLIGPLYEYWKEGKVIDS